jgi:hypothetical protein
MDKISYSPCNIRLGDHLYIINLHEYLLWVSEIHLSTQIRKTKLFKLYLCKKSL